MLKMRAFPTVLPSILGYLCVLAITPSCSKEPDETGPRPRKEETDTRPRLDGKVVTPVAPICDATNAWRGKWDESALLFRYENDKKNSFLLHPYVPPESAATPVEAIHRYDPDRDDYTTVTGDVWLRATGLIRRVSFNRVLRRVSLSQFDGASRTLKTASGKVVATAGSKVLAVLPSPSGRYASVVSTTGKHRMGWPGANPTPRGPRYQQLFLLPEYKPFGDVVELPGASYILWWTPDERYLLYRTCVIPVNAPGG